MGVLSGFTIAGVIHSLKDLYGISIGRSQLIVYSREIRADFFDML